MKMKITPFCLVLIVFCLCAVLGTVLGQDSPFVFSHHLATKTPYWSPSTANTNLPNCKPVHIEHVNRHGSRWPSKGDTNALLQTLGKLRGLSDKITNPQYSWIKNYSIPYSLESESLLSPNGEIELYNLGRNYLSRYPEIFDIPFDPNLFTLQSTQSERAGRSGVSFAFGVWEGKGTVSNQSFDPFYIWSQTTSLDIVLRSQDNCPKWMNEIYSNDTTYEASSAYSTAVLPQIAQKINQILGVSSLTPSDASALYTACQFDVILFNTESLWCSLFNQSDILFLEYIDDLDVWYANAYYEQINLEVISPLFQDMVSNLDNVISLISKGSSVVPLAYLRFAHQASISPLTAMLGLFKGNYTLNANNYNPNRKWFSSRTSCMEAVVSTQSTGRLPFSLSLTLPWSSFFYFFAHFGRLKQR
eukprot:TRINITY_DN3151_c0_g1_i2.p1 TRINITY_DN3151_c0_g1~~TRINITY_DN3151_c0_g1_i2.p1  ORF type:complete len:417 (+),score=51.12 TRINITY_DN3151_c0_g1_i2:220-1470(+)